MAQSKERYWVRFPRGFRAGDEYWDQGQVVTLRGARNDQLLIDLGYVMLLQETAPRLATCGVCGAQFLEDRFREAHGRRRHSSAAPPEVRPAGAGVGLEDVTGDREERLLEQTMAPYLDKKP